MIRLDRRALITLDVVLAAGLVAFSVYALTQPWDDGFRTHSGWLDTAAVTAMSAPFALRTLSPTWGLGLVLIGQLTAGLVGPHTLLFYSGFVPFAVMIYAVARRDDGWPGRLTWGALPLLLLSDAGVPDVRSASNLVFSSVLLGATWTAGRVVRRLARRGEELRVTLVRLELEHEAGERQAVELERSRVAAEMHDVVGHALSLMVLQTGAARAELAALPGSRTDVRDQLRSAEDAGRAALDDLRQALGLLRGVPLGAEADTSAR